MALGVSANAAGHFDCAHRGRDFADGLCVRVREIRPPPSHTNTQSESDIAADNASSLHSLMGRFIAIWESGSWIRYWQVMSCSYRIRIFGVRCEGSWRVVFYLVLLVSRRLHFVVIERRNEISWLPDGVDECWFGVWFGFNIIAINIWTSEQCVQWDLLHRLICDAYTRQYIDMGLGGSDGIFPPPKTVDEFEFIWLRWLSLRKDGAIACWVLGR